MDAFDADVPVCAAVPDHSLGLPIPELLSEPMRDGADSRIEALAALVRLDLRPVDEALSGLAAALGSTHRLRATDAVHLASAVGAGARRARREQLDWQTGAGLVKL